jgi:hypothetical protein
MQAEARPTLEIKTGNTVVDIIQDGHPFLVYNYASQLAGLFKPFVHPVMGPFGWPITQNGEFPGTLRGHYWHRALFVGHQKVSHRTDSGSRITSFWEEQEQECGRILHESFDPKPNDASALVQRLVWRSTEGRDLLREVRVLRFLPSPQDRRFFDIEIALKAAREAIRLEKTRFSLLACQTINSLCSREEKLAYKEKYGNLVDFTPLLAGGKLVNSEGQEGDAIQGQRAKWCDCSGPLDNVRTGGIAILDHPLNERHPTPWHHWHHMAFMASFTYHDHYELTPEKELRLRYRILIHAGDAKEADVERAWNDFAHRG